MAIIKRSLKLAIKQKESEILKIKREFKQKDQELREKWDNKIVEIEERANEEFADLKSEMNDALISEEQELQEITKTFDKFQEVDNESESEPEPEELSKKFEKLKIGGKKR